MATKMDIQAHYDVNESGFFRKVLGESMSYTCADWSGQNTLEEAQNNKLKKIAAFAGINDQTRSVLDLGCGWGSTQLWLQINFPGLERNHGVTISTEQCTYARSQMTPSLSKGSPVSIIEDDMSEYLERYADLPYDAALSIGAIEHLASPRDYRHGTHIERYHAFFTGVHRCVSGKFALQSIVAMKKPNQLKGLERQRAIRFQYFIAKYVFPNALTPALSYLDAALSGLYEVDQFEVKSDDYARTLSCWRDNLIASRTDISRQRYELFLRYFDLCIEHFSSGYLGLARYSLSPIRIEQD